ncbi:3'-5' exoribonuclease that releases 5'-nucleoside monophosphates and is involved in maturation of structured RNAs [Vibrio sp. B1FIG11]|uniref:ribonuclease R n=1 Tax=Vibrio sp. B1FIG11 TaxID=2751177 RepID=UPI001AF6A8DF|nr:ribonuclease R [Vibrio sp. B1FIG11]CAD7815890.1 3'-5' exoribonuclease that releases 5'-nucleoside monophosphates and is involved in maturation of structured RNAs [Vibrio sp. B1FIG11]CAE6926515.1 3'-5' exoribonuclease that releases 5'-nucleoside monophosphates and is involved in maturation of structured RNAs [Vibrio sp. B1FIG11]
MSDNIPNDPFADRESKNYENPIPSREFILEFLEEAGVPMNRNDLFEALKLKGEEQYEGLRRRLRAMERDGQLVFTRRQCYALPEKLEMVKGYVIGHKDGHGWVRPEGSVGKDNDIVLPHHQMKHIIHGDYVLVQPTDNSKRGRREGRLVRVLEERNTQIVGRFFLEYGYSYVVPDDSRISQDILIPNEHKAGARMGNVVVIEITDRGSRSRGMMGKVVEVLGENMAPGMETQIAIRTHQIPHDWPEAVDKQIENLGEEVPEEAKVGRVDLRDLPLVTIDGEDARDFDDAVYCEKKKSGGWRLWVAIADVSYYVRTDSALDKEAINRGNSVYFPSQVVPMLPEVLSNGLCSLNPQVDRLCMVCEMTISDTGKLSGYKHYEAVMNSHARLTYNKVGAILEGDEELRMRYHAVVPHLEELHAMYKVLKEARDNRGAIEFETVEAKFIFNADRKIESIEPVIRNDAHKIIEECMILANIASASYVEKAKEPALYRVHESPGELRLQGFRDFLSELGLDLKGGLEPSPTDYADLVKQIAERQDKELIQTMLLRSMKQAVYNADNAGHFGLALKRYAHFTSPIRRYPDLLLHRAIKYLIAKEEGRNQDRWTPTGGYHYSFDDMDFYGEQCSMTERRADDATREVADWLKCEYMQDHVGDELDGVIANVTSFGFFVRLTELHIDGLVHISTLANDYYQFDPIGQRLIGESFGNIYRLGDAVKVKVLAVNLNDKQIDFELIETSRKLRGKGKTAKKRAADAKRKAKEKKRAATKGGTRATPAIEPTKRPEPAVAEKPRPNGAKRSDTEGAKKPKVKKARKKKPHSKPKKTKRSKSDAE